MPQLEEPTTKTTQLCTGGLWGEKGKNKIFKKKKKKLRVGTPVGQGHRIWSLRKKALIEGTNYLVFSLPSFSSI